MIPFLFAFLCSVAGARPPDEIMASPGLDFYDGILMRACDEMGTGFLDDLENLHRSREKLSVLLRGGPDQFKEAEALIVTMRELSERIRAVAKPEWSTENTNLTLTWFIPRSYFLEELDQLRITGPEVLEAHFLNRPNEDVKDYFSVRPHYNAATGLKMVYQKKGTALEMCQLVRTLHFTVGVRYRKILLGSRAVFFYRKFKLGFNGR